MAKKNKLWFSGEDAQLAARFTKFMTKVLYARRASYIRALMVRMPHWPRSLPRIWPRC